jgi:hypothetical protein
VNLITRTCLLMLSVCLLAGCGHTGPRQLQFFPGAASYNARHNEWEAPVQGWVFQARRSGLIRDAAWLYMQTLIEDIPGKDPQLARERRAATHRLFDERAGFFLVEGRGNKLVIVELGGHKYLSPPTDAGGQFSFNVKLTAEQAQKLLDHGSIRYQGYIFDGPVAKAIEAVKDVAEAAAPQAAADAKADIPPPLNQEHKYAQGYVRLIRPAGVAVISDIDDTIKISDGLDRRGYIRRMFLDPFIEVPGMAEAYRHWADQGAEVFYVSASPWQLYTAFSAFTTEYKFPEGVFVLKRIGIFDAYMSNIWVSTLRTKTRAIDDIFKRFPDRRFVLVGDSVEHDHDMYAGFARKFPGRVIHIYIRDMRHEGRAASRFTEAFAGVPRERWSLFDTGWDLPERLQEAP